ncbi:histidinol-phosphate transaminase [Aureitalea marina]|uniref:Histidinol-phosphate aminotransferase n=1 Tax=Aureitalea marina TaxID=930804 RepID=A0A2S7KP82_9FLAO|nr:histidinol-phosphate transaminase [Aureitalea marina]PQB04439.1 histidinol-phosphate transaminase [Aureitalea marina]
MKVEKLIRPWINSLQAYSSARDEFVGEAGGMVFLDANENPFETGVNRYPDPRQRSLKSLLAKNKGVPEDQLILGNGSDEILDLLFRIFCEPGQDNVLLLPPTYGMYKVLADINRVDYQEVALNKKFQIDVEGILGAISDRTKMVFVCSPNNPTGNLIRPELIEALLTGLNTVVVVDEAYIDFAAAPSWSNRLKEFPNLVVIQTLSKAYGLAGIRLGMAMAHPLVIEAMNRIKPPYNVNQLTQQRAIARLESGLGTEVEQILEERAYLADQLNEFPFVEEVFPSEANFILIRVDDGPGRYREILDKGIVLRDRSKQLGCENTLRITVGTAAENKLLLNVLKQLQ